jgi:hypothetical protein
MKRILFGQQKMEKKSRGSSTGIDKKIGFMK